ncbi:DUF1403 family protein [Mesorhizobium sp. B2-5-7]|uniref:DUF1403 family protein n=1 Tax=Mesorhizobium sp. B2-5-7 TaxID=2589923 RepID=UPI001129ADEC|nr:DUF1403 family protein [Mesorhizobium sp. B2-5-7]TPK10514.1 DUF1403 family protein [Mesorhizobium sp. B2-5-7]
MIPTVAPPPSPYHPPAVPAWALPRGPVTGDAEAAFLAGAALNSLDNLARAEPVWAGAWRQRLALKAAAAAVRLAGRTEDEAALRDAWYLRQLGDVAGPGGNILAAWKRLASRSPKIDGESLRGIIELLGLRWSAELATFPDRIDDLVRSGSPAPFAAAVIAGQLQALRPDGAVLAWWLADLTLAQRLRWPRPVPLLVTQVHTAAFRATGGRGRIRPGDEGFDRAVCTALAQAAAEACRLAADIARCAERLAVVMPKLRAKGAGEAIRLLLAEDAVSGSLVTPRLSRFASRRLFERLTKLDAVRELSGRPVFRLYGL